jgi:hypothetical protein
MFFDDFVHILPINIGIPDPFGIYDYYRPFFTAVKAPGRIDSNPAWSGHTQVFATLFGIIAHGKRIEALATDTAVFSKIGAEKYVITIVGHLSTIPENAGRVKKPPTGKRPPDHAILFL